MIARMLLKMKPEMCWCSTFFFSAQVTKATKKKHPHPCTRPWNTATWYTRASLSQHKLTIVIAAWGCRWWLYCCCYCYYCCHRCHSTLGHRRSPSHCRRLLPSVHPTHYRPSRSHPARPDGLRTPRTDGDGGREDAGGSNRRPRSGRPCGCRCHPCLYFPCSCFPSFWRTS